MNKIKIGVFGGGVRGVDLTRNFLMLNCDIVALCDFRPERLRLARRVRRMGRALRTRKQRRAGVRRKRRPPLSAARANFEPPGAPRRGNGRPGNRNDSADRRSSRNERFRAAVQADRLLYDLGRVVDACRRRLDYELGERRRRVRVALSH